jgi:transcriptional regulator GlxA family with amidase domain
VRTLSADLSESERKVTEIEAFLHEYNGIGLRVPDIALRFGISERHLSRLFRDVRGYSLRDAMNREKLKKIEELVISTELSLSEISQLCGFSDEYAMNKFFRRLNKINLSEFRRIGAANRKE